MLAPGTRALVAVKIADNFTPEEVTRAEWPGVSEDGIVTLANTECSDGAEVDGHTVDEVIEMVAACVPGRFVDRPVVTGAMCFPPEFE